MSEAPLAATLLDHDSKLDRSDRLRGAIWGQLVGDAFCLGTHWIYDLDEMKQAFPDGVRGFERPAERHYHAGKQPYDQTHYGEAALLMLESVASLGGFDVRDFGARFLQYFGAPGHRGYLDHATRDTLANAAAFAKDHPGEPFDYQRGADDDQLATVSRLAPLVALYGPGPRDALLVAVEAATRFAQQNDRAVTYAKADALVLAALLEGQGLHAALQETEEAITNVDPIHGGEVRLKLRAAAESTLQTVQTATLGFGQSCHLENSFPASVHCFAKHSTSFNNAMLANAGAGGDNAGRAAMLGAWLGALLGVEAIPAAWRERLAARASIAVWIERLVDITEGVQHTAHA